MQEVTEQPPVWSAPVDEVLARLATSADGLTSDQARERLAETGPNRLPPPEPTPWWRRALAQFQDTLIYILLASAAAKAALGDWVDFTVILAVAVINAAIGLIQEGRAEKALAGIRTMLSVQADVRRDGGWERVDAEQLVPGDVVRLRAGDKVPADLRLIAASNLQAEESALTGESVPTSKDADVVAVDAGIGDRTDMVFSGTLITARDRAWGRHRDRAEHRGRQDPDAGRRGRAARDAAEPTAGRVRQGARAADRRHGGGDGRRRTRRARLRR